jgi:Protein of unknown function (DUF3551)
MRLLLFILEISVSIVGIGNRAEAQNYPWCLIYGTGFGGKNCGFTTFQQCQDTVSGIGGFCQQNNTYQLPPGSHPSTRVDRRYPY